MRELNDFKGSALLVGGGWSAENQYMQPFIRCKANFYTVDKDPDIKPDAIIDFSDPEQCAQLPSKRFDFIYFECMPFKDVDITLAMFKNAHRLLSDDGILIYRGGCSESISIPTLLQQAGFTFSIKKEITDASKWDYKENGVISFAANFDIKKIADNEVQCDKVARFYLNQYGFMSASSFTFSESRVSLFLNCNLQAPTPLDKQAIINGALWNAKRPGA